MLKISLKSIRMAYGFLHIFGSCRVQVFSKGVQILSVARFKSKNCLRNMGEKLGFGLDFKGVGGE